MKLPIMPNGWTWDFDRTADVVMAEVRDDKGWVVASGCLVASQTLAAQVYLLALKALALAFIYRPIAGRVIRVRAAWTKARERRSERIQEIRFARAVALNGSYDNRGHRSVAA